MTTKEQTIQEKIFDLLKDGGEMRIVDIRSKLPESPKSSIESTVYFMLGTGKLKRNGKLILVNNPTQCLLNEVWKGVFV